MRTFITDVVAAIVAEVRERRIPLDSLCSPPVGRKRERWREVGEAWAVSRFRLEEQKRQSGC